ncbi:hypothetical protein HN018_04525 [Lichenicola cladoniae]|uniref:Uncharacterized protein n=1 Tax=Lichenicola cladoniae TaxID=1484109 RepID=A0A6M8HM51_9PROT|nr:hypothetical protein [Lichenicola cladoniae]NPD66835.1 hypothetical protein [Acetobacteraceae bacterium]QKE89400.1 hypothetical protein HN018_04525 [Lichenicola cladoniae]
MLVMVASAWQIYNSSPPLPSSFSHWVPLGGWLGGGIAWHLAAMWLLAGNALICFSSGMAGRHFSKVLFARDWAEVRHRSAG